MMQLQPNSETNQTFATPNIQHHLSSLFGGLLTWFYKLRKEHQKIAVEPVFEIPKLYGPALLITNFQIQQREYLIHTTQIREVPETIVITIFLYAKICHS